MELKLIGDPKELAALVVGLQERQVSIGVNEVDLKRVAQATCDRLRGVQERPESSG